MSPVRLILFALLSLSCLAVLPAVAAPQYTLQDLGTLTPGGTAQPQGINQAGQVFGSASSSTTNLSLPNHLFFWSPQGGMIDIEALPDSRPATAYPAEGFRAAVAMNDQGQIVGESEVEFSIPGEEQFGTVSHAFLWTPALDGKSGTLRDLGTLGANSQADIGTTAVAVNNHGQVTGTASALTLTPQGYRQTDPPHGFLWTPGGTGGVASNPQMKDLGLLHPSLLDDAGRVIGLLNGVLTLYDGQNSVSLGDPPGFDPNGLYSGYRIVLQRTDAQGNIYGSFSTPTVSTNPFVWVPDHMGGTTGHFVVGVGTDTPIPPPGALTDAQLPASAQAFWASANVFAFSPADATVSAVDLGGLFFDPYSLSNSAFPAFTTYPLALNSSKDLVGTSYLSNGPSGAFLEHAGLMYDLNLHIQGPNAGVYQLWDGVGINDGGQIAASGSAGFPLHAFLLTPAGQAAPAAPTIQLIQPQPPDAGDPDQTVDIVGTRFQVGAAVTYDGSPLTATVYAETQIIAHIPSADLTAGTHTVTVTNPDGSAGSGPYVVLPLRPVPTLTAVSPVSLPAGSPDTTITLTGTGLYPETQIGFGYVAPGQTFLTVLSASADHTQITARLLASQMAQGAVLTFYAYTAGQRGTPQSTPPPTLTVVNPVPTITSISPPSLVADGFPTFTLTVNGTGFVPSTTVSWGGRNFPTTYVSPTQVTAFIYGYNSNYPSPDTAPPGPVTVSVINNAPGGGTASTTQTITDGPYPAPVLTSVSPSSMPFIRSSSSVTLTGGHFMHHSVVHLGSRVFPLESLSDDRTQLSFYLSSSVVLPVGVYPVTVVNPGPGGGTSATLSLTIQEQGGITHTHLLWTNTNGTAAIWTVSPDGSFTSTPGYGPIPGWTARMIADGLDGKTRLLWTRSDGMNAVWTVNNSDGSYTSTPGYGPYDAGKWAVASLAVGPDNRTRLQWKHSPDGQSSVWTVAADGSFTSTPGFGPYGTWTAGALAVGGDGLSRLLWGDGAGRFSVWTLDALSSVASTPAFGPIPGWSPTAIAGGLDTNARLLLNRTDGAMAVWTVNAASAVASTPLYGPIPSWSCHGLAVGPDGLSRVLWSRSDGMSSVWTIAADGSIGSTPGYGPYSGWSAVALSVGL